MTTAGASVPGDHFLLLVGGVAAAAQHFGRCGQKIEAVVGEVLVDQREQDLGKEFYLLFMGGLFHSSTADHSLQVGDKLLRNVHPAQQLLQEAKGKPFLNGRCVQFHVLKAPGDCIAIHLQELQQLLGLLSISCLLLGRESVVGNQQGVGPTTLGFQLLLLLPSPRVVVIFRQLFCHSLQLPGQGNAAEVRGLGVVAFSSIIGLGTLGYLPCFFSSPSSPPHPPWLSLSSIPRQSWPSRTL